MQLKKVFSIVVTCLTVAYGYPRNAESENLEFKNVNQDPDAAETTYGGNAGGQSKYFQDTYSVQLSPDKIEFGHVCETPHDWEQRYERKDFAANKHQGKDNHYEFGHRKGNGDHFNERHEKAQTHDGQFRTKVRWGDKHGGYGEHYWDYNHAGHGDHSDDGDSEESQNVAEYDEDHKTKTSDVESDTETDDYSREKRHEQSPETVESTRKFIYDSESNILIDATSGKMFKLYPLN